MTRKDNPNKTSDPAKKTTIRKRGPKTKKQRLIERLTRLGIDTKGMTQTEMQTEINRIKDEGSDVPDLRAENQGAPVVVGKSPQVQEIKELHLMEEVDVIVTRRELSGQSVTTSEKKSRLVAILDMLSHEAVTKKNVPAAKEYMDRTLGKSRQGIDLQTIKKEEQRTPTEAELEATEAYIAVLEEYGEA